MKREEEIRQFALERNSEGDFDSNDGYQGIIEGAQWADEHPKSQWVSVENRLPERMTSRDSNGAKIINCCSKDVFGYDAWYKIGRLVCYNHESERWESHDAYRIGKISHWKPIITPEQEAE